jgi:hypothetical protein
MQYNALQAEIDVLTDQRTALHRQKWRYGDSVDISAEITRLTECLRDLRRALRLCIRIEGDVPRCANVCRAYGMWKNCP